MTLAARNKSLPWMNFATDEPATEALAKTQIVRMGFATDELATEALLRCS